MPSPRDHNTEEHLIEPLTQLYGKLPPEKRTHYLEALKKFTDSQLKDGFIQLRDYYGGIKFPSIADINKAVSAGTRKQPGAGNLGPRPKQPWEIRAENQDQLVKTYVDQFMGSPLAYEAKRDGWDLQLERYVRAVARVQAQLLTPGNGGVGWDSTIIFGFGIKNQADIDRKRFEFFRDMRQQASTGQILVAVPVDRIEDWKADVGYKKSLSPSYGAPIENKRHIKSQLDATLKKANTAPDSAVDLNAPYNSITSRSDFAGVDQSEVF